jgi:hypothetical protein
MTALDRLRLRAAGLCLGRPAQALYFLGAGWVKLPTALRGRFRGRAKNIGKC